MLEPCKEKYVTRWEYRTIDFGELPPRVRPLTVLNTAGGQGWELVAIVANNVAYLKRPIGQGSRATKVSEADNRS